VTGKLTNHLTFFCSSRRGQKRDEGEEEEEKSQQVAMATVFSHSMRLDMQTHAKAQSYHSTTSSSEKKKGRSQEISNMNASLSWM
jgi:hypothetical protein